MSCFSVLPSPWLRACLLAAVALLAAFPARAAVPAPLDADIGRFVQALKGAGFTVQEGTATYVDVFAAVAAGALISCNGNNAANPYLTCALPQGPGQTGSDPNGVIYNFFLDPGEAVVWVGMTPPEMKYFSYRSYLVNRRYPGTRSYAHVYDSLGDPTNRMKVRTSNTPNGTGTNPYNATVMFVTTADNGTYTRIVNAGALTGFPESLINKDVLPSKMLNMGLSEGDDIFNILFRAAEFKDNATCWDYINDPPMRVFRVTPATGTALDPLAAPTLTVRGTGATEMDMSADLDTLRRAIIDAHPKHQATDLITNIWLPEGYIDIQTRFDGLGEGRDTPYLKSGNFRLSDSPDDFVVVYGVNHAYVGKATYSSFTVYSDGVYCGVTGVNSDNYLGSARKFLDSSVSDPDRFYAWTLSRSGGTDTLVVPADPIPYGIPLGHDAFVAFRAYVEPATTVGPAAVELLFGRAIHFTPAKGSSGSNSGCTLGGGAGSAWLLVLLVPFLIWLRRR